MRTRARPLERAPWLLMLWAILGRSEVAVADGGLFITEESRIEEVYGGTQASAALEGLVSSSGQRAVMWQGDDGCWDMFVDPGDIEVSGAAWVMPLPVLPTAVTPASAEFIDHLDAATTPILMTEYTRIIEYYRYVESGGGSGGFGCGLGAADVAAPLGEEYMGEDTVAEGEEGTGVQTGVRIWQSGRLGDVEYEVVSSEDPAALETWLADNGYVNPEGLSSLLAEYTSSGHVFFTARLARSPEDPTRVPVFRFTLCDVDVPPYPLRLSTLSVASHLEFTLWFVLPSGHRGYAPTNATLGYFGSFYESTIDTEWESVPDFEQLYLDRREELSSVVGSRVLVVELAADLMPSAVDQRIDVEGEFSATFPLTSDRSSWAEELSTITSDGLHVVRLSGRFPISAMSEDLEFLPGEVSTDTGIYRREVIEYDYEYDYETPSDEDPEGTEVEPVFDDATACRVTSHSPRAADGGRKASILAIIFVAGLLVWRRLRTS